MPRSTIPIIDLAPFLSGSESDRLKAAQQIKEACETIGFFLIKGHGIPLEIIQAAHQSANQFFDLPASEKMKVTAVNGLGYIRLQGENLAASLDKEGQQDYNESLNLTLPIAQAIWPLQPAVLRQDCLAYYEQLLVLASQLMRLFALALNIEETFFDKKIDKPRTILRLLNYPPLERAANQARAGAHTDYGTLTILWSPDSRGLQAKNRAGEWLDVIASPEQFIINIGDLMMNWTNDKWLSTLHRVGPHPGNRHQRRQSMAFFHNPNPEALITCLDSCTSADEPPKYAPILAREHLAKKIAKSLGQKSVQL